MDAVIMDASNDAREIVELASCLYSEGFENIIIFSHLDERDFFLIQISLYESGVNAIPLKCGKGEKTSDLIKAIKGSLTGSFLLVYSPSICAYDIVASRALHRGSCKCATIILGESKLYGVYLESEVFDYLEITSSLEREALPRIFADDEGGVYYLSSYEIEQQN